MKNSTSVPNVFFFPQKKKIPGLPVHMLADIYMPFSFD